MLKKLTIIHYWALINIVLPVIVVFILGVEGVSNVVTGTLSYGSVLVLFMGNIYLLQRPSKIAWLVALTLGLNILAITILGNISFFTSIPVLVGVFSSAG